MAAEALNSLTLGPPIHLNKEVTFFTFYYLCRVNRADMDIMITNLHFFWELKSTKFITFFFYV